MVINEEDNQWKVQQKKKENIRQGEVNWKGLCQQNILKTTKPSLGSWKREDIDKEMMQQRKWTTAT